MSGVMSKRQAVHRTGHLNVSNYRLEVYGARFQDLDGLIGICGRDSLKTVLPKTAEHGVSHLGMIFDEQHRHAILFGSYGNPHTTVNHRFGKPPLRRVAPYYDNLSLSTRQKHWTNIA